MGDAPSRLDSNDYPRERGLVWGGIMWVGIVLVGRCHRPALSGFLPDYAVFFLACAVRISWISV